MTDFKVCKLTDSVKVMCATDCAEKGYPVLSEIFERGTNDELVLKDINEAYMVIRYAAILRADAELKFPYWSEASPYYNEAHEDGYQDVQMGHYLHLLNAVVPEFNLDMPDVVDPEYKV